MPGFDDHYPRLYDVAYRVAFTVLGDRDEAEDAAQEALVRALLHWGRVERYAEPWVARVSANVAIDRIRRQRRLRPDSPPVPTNAPDPVDRVVLQEALLRLSRRQREVVVLRYIADLADEDVARVLGCSPGAVKQHGARALARLRRVLAIEAP